MDAKVSVHERARALDEKHVPVPRHGAGISRSKSSRSRSNERRRIERLEGIIVDQDQTIQRLIERLQQLEPRHPQPRLNGDSPKPAIY